MINNGKQIRDEHISRLLTKLKEELKKSLNKEFLNKPIEINDIKSFTNGYFSSKHHDMKFINYEVINEGPSIEIIPKNLYTLLVLNGISYPPFMLEGLTEFKTDYGIFTYKNDKAGFIPNSAEYIHFTLNVLPKNTGFEDLNPFND